MEKQLLKNQEDYDFLNGWLIKDCGEHLYAPDSYPCVILYQAIDIPQGWSLEFGYIYPHDFVTED